MLTLYKTIVDFAYFLLWPILWVKTRQKREIWSQRRCLNPEAWLPGYNLKNKDGQPGPLIWAHASSMGEVRVLKRLMDTLLATKPSLRFCISTYTGTGQKLAEEIFQKAEAIFYFPLDSSLPVKRFFNRFQPDGIVTVETEIWPVFLSNCGRLKIPVIMTNGRISEKSFKRYRWFRKSLTRLFMVYGRFVMQSEDDARRIIDIGADRGKVIVAGNIKHDIFSASDNGKRRHKERSKLAIAPDEILFVAASTRPGEEEIICRTMRRLSSVPGKIKLLIAPRHLERLPEVQKILDSHGFAYISYSEIGSGEATADVILMDQMGYLAELFYGADITFVGGTLADLGGHNLMEPVAAGVPVLFGSSVFNVRAAADKILSQNLGMMITGEDELVDALQRVVNRDIHFSKIDELKADENTDSVSAAEQTARIIIEDFRL